MSQQVSMNCRITAAVHLLGDRLLPIEFKWFFCIICHFLLHRPSMKLSHPISAWSSTASRMPCAVGKEEVGIWLPFLHKVRIFLIHSISGGNVLELTQCGMMSFFTFLWKCDFACGFEQCSIWEGFSFGPSEPLRQDGSSISFRLHLMWLQPQCPALNRGINRCLLTVSPLFYCSIWGWPINLTSVRNGCVVMGLPIVGNNWFDNIFIQISMFRGCLLNYLRNNSNLLKEIRSADSRKRRKLFIYSTRCCPFHLILQ